MENIALIHVAVTEGRQRLEINGTLDLFKRLFGNGSGSAPTVHNPLPQSETSAAGCTA